MSQLALEPCPGAKAARQVKCHAVGQKLNTEKKDGSSLEKGKWEKSGDIHDFTRFQPEFQNTGYRK